MTPIHFLPGDVVLTRGSGVVSRLIRKFTTSGGEEPAAVNHVGIVIRGGTAREATIIEALGTGVKHNFLWRYAGVTDEVAVFRYRDFSHNDRALVSARAKAYEGRAYGYLKLGTQWLDWLIGDRYLFRRLTRMDDFPICSWLVAKAYGDLGVDFGVRREQATPDDIWDHCTTHQADWELIHPLGPLTEFHSEVSLPAS